MRKQLPLLLLATLATVSAQAGVLTYGDEDCLGQGCYTSDPTAGATLQGLLPGMITVATFAFGHGFPFSPDPGDFAGTDTIFVGSIQTGAHDGYSGSSQRVNGPQVLTLDYSSLLSPGDSLSTLTLGIAADDFQFPALGQPFTAMVNGAVDPVLTAQLNAFNQGGPQVQFFTIGLDPAIDTGSHILTLSIDDAGDGGDGWAVDFLTVGATTTAVGGVPELSSIAMLSLGLGGLALATRLRKG